MSKSSNTDFVQALQVDSSLGNEQFKTDKRQFAGVMLVLSMCAIIFPLANLTGLINRDGETVKSGIALSSLFATLVTLAIGLIGGTTGYLTLVHDYGHKLLTGLLLVFVQFAYIPYVTDMTSVGKAARTGAAFIPPSYDPSEADVKFVGAIGIIGVFCYGFCFLGSVAFMGFSLFAYQAGKPGDRSGMYYQGRLRFYAFLVTLVGLAQLLLGAYIRSSFGSGPLPEPIGVAMFVVHFPELSIFVGLVYMLNGLYGLVRAFGCIPSSPTDHSLQFGLYFQYLCTVSIMVVTQMSYAPGNAFAPAAPSVAALTTAAHVLPAFLDYKARTTPKVLPENYFGLDDDEVKEVSSDNVEKPLRRMSSEFDA